MISKYPPLDADILDDSFKTLWVFKQQQIGKEELMVIDVKEIIAVISILPLPGATDGTWFLSEKLGLDVVHRGGQDEVMNEE